MSQRKLKPKEQLSGWYERCYKGSTKTSLITYFEDYRSFLQQSEFYRHFDRKDKNYLLNSVTKDKICEDKLAVLEEHCSIGHLTVEGELERTSKVNYDLYKDSQTPAVIEKSIQLHTVQYTKQRNLLKNYKVPCKYRSERPIVSLILFY